MLLKAPMNRSSRKITDKKRFDIMELNERKE